MTGYPDGPDPLPRPIADSHCHLDMGYDHDPLPVDQALALAAGVGVTHVIQVGCDVSGSRWAAEVAADHPPMCGRALPCTRTKRRGFNRQVASRPWKRHCARSPSSPGCPRCAPSARPEWTSTALSLRPGSTEESFRAHIALAKAEGKALVVHDREAHADVLRILDDEGAPERVVMHCFSGDADFARDVSERGFSARSQA